MWNCVQGNEYEERISSDVILVVVLGGDGTLTSISHNIDENTPVMGVNSHPISLDANGSVGFYMDSTLETFAEDFSAALW